MVGPEVLRPSRRSRTRSGALRTPEVKMETFYSYYRGLKNGPFLDVFRMEVLDSFRERKLLYVFRSDRGQGPT